MYYSVTHIMYSHGIDSNNMACVHEALRLKASPVKDNTLACYQYRHNNNINEIM